MKHRRDVVTDSTPLVRHTVACDRRTNPCGYCAPSWYARWRARHRSTLAVAGIATAGDDLNDELMQRALSTWGQGTA